MTKGVNREVHRHGMYHHFSGQKDLINTYRRMQHAYGHIGRIEYRRLRFQRWMVKNGRLNEGEPLPERFDFSQPPVENTEVKPGERTMYFYQELHRRGRLTDDPKIHQVERPEEVQPMYHYTDTAFAELIRSLSMTSRPASIEETPQEQEAMIRFSNRAFIEREYSEILKYEYLPLINVIFRKKGRPISSSQEIAERYSFENMQTRVSLKKEGSSIKIEALNDLYLPLPPDETKGIVWEKFEIQENNITYSFKATREGKVFQTIVTSQNSDLPESQSIVRRLRTHIAMINTKIEELKNEPVERLVSHELLFTLPDNDINSEQGKEMVKIIKKIYTLHYLKAYGKISELHDYLKYGNKLFEEDTGLIIEFKPRENLIEVYVKRDVNEEMKTVHAFMRNFGNDTSLVGTNI